MNIDKLELLFVIWAFFFQIVLIIHFAVRKPFFEIYTKKYGWIVYALCIPAALISIILMFNGATWSFVVGGFLFVFFAIFGYRIDYDKEIQWRKPLNKRIMFPYVTLYLSTIMFYWWPLALIHKPLWYIYAVLFLISTILNIRSH